MIFDLLILYTLFFITSGFMEIPGDVVMVSCIIINLALIYKYKNTIKITLKSVMFILFIFISIMLSLWISGETVKNIVITLIYFMTSYIYVNAISLHKYITVYNKLLVIIALISIITYFLWLVTPELFSGLPVIVNSRGAHAYFAIFSAIRPSSNLFRNQGIFWEPGAYQTFLNIALMINLFILKNHPRRVLKIIILSLALLTTFSTTGYIVGLLVFMAFVLDNILVKQKFHSKKLKAIFSAIFAILLILLVFLVIPLDNKYQVFNKFDQLNDFDNGRITSASVRFDAIKYPLIAFIESPIFGIGYSGIADLARENGFYMFTSTPVNWLAIFGVFVGSILNFGFIKFASLFTHKRIIKILLIIALLISILSEEYSRNPSILIISMYYFITLNKNTESLT